MIDTHTHLYLFEDDDQNKEESGLQNSGSFPLTAFASGVEALRRALEAGVDRMILPCVDEESMYQLLDMHHRFPAVTYMAKGLHPTSIDADWRAHLDRILKGFEGERVVAIGEVGIDLYWSQDFRREQIEAFAEQVCLAKSEDLPVIIHCRNGLDDTLDVLRSVGDGVKAVFHSFTGGAEDVARIKSVGDYYFGINGVVTFKNAAELREAVPLIGVDRILLETDSPYLAPVPYRGKRNESAYLPKVQEKLAELLALDIDAAETQFVANTVKFFGL